MKPTLSMISRTLVQAVVGDEGRQIISAPPAPSPDPGAIKGLCEAARGLLDAFGGNPPEWLAAEAARFEKALEAFRPARLSTTNLELEAEQMKNKIIAIGWTGLKRCYLNISREEALDRYKAEQGDHGFDADEVPIKEIEFDDVFEAYDVG